MVGRKDDKGGRKSEKGGRDLPGVSELPSPLAMMWRPHRRPDFHYLHTITLECKHKGLPRRAKELS